MISPEYAIFEFSNSDTVYVSRTSWLGIFSRFVDLLVEEVDSNVAVGDSEPVVWEDSRVSKPIDGTLLLCRSFYVHNFCPYTSSAFQFLSDPICVTFHDKINIRVLFVST